MRLALVTVGSAVVGSMLVLLSTGGAPTPAEAHGPPVELEPVRGHHAGGAGGCPPCRGTPLEAVAWREQLRAPESAAALERAAALSLTLPDPASIDAALAGDDPTLRSLAALLLNVGSERVAACAPVGRQSVLQVLDRLDRLAWAVRSGQPATAESISVATAQADLVSRGLVPGCGG